MEKKWQKALLSKEATFREVVTHLEKTRLKIAVLVDEDDSLLGIITDGDIRSHLLKEVDLESPALNMANKKPIVAKESATRQEKIELVLKHGISSIPIVNEKYQVVGVEFLREFLKKKQDTLVFIMAGGFGTRLAPLTDTCPKPMLKVGDKPILETIILHFKKLGFWRFAISVHYLPEVIKDYFGDGHQFGIHIDYIDESPPLGTGGALSLLPLEDIGNSLIMINGDILTNMDFSKLLTFHQSTTASVTVCVKEYKTYIPYGVIETRGNYVKSIKEKPSYSHYVSTGIYLLDKDFIETMSEKGERVDMPTLLTRYVEAGNKVNTYDFNEYWLDIGKMKDFEKAQVDYKGLFND